MATSSFQLDPSLANLPLDVLKKKYEDLTPDERRMLGFTRPATQQEFDAAQGSQSGAPADFAGRVLPNPDNVHVSEDTESGIPDLRLPNGVSATTGSYNGTPKLDTSNPAPAQVIPAAMQTVEANFNQAQLNKENSDATVPMYDPDGKLRDIPYSQVSAARDAGAKMGVRVKAPDGKTRIVPADQMQEAVAHGGTVLPMEDQAVQHEGFWNALGGDLWGMMKGAKPTSATDAASMVVPGVGAYEQGKQLGEDDKARKAEGQSTYERVVAPVAQMTTGVNARGMEQAANAGDVAGVAGHAAAPIVATAAVEGLTHGVNAIAGRVSGDAVSASANAGRDAAVAGTKAAIKKLPASMIKRIPYVGQVAADVAEAAHTAYNESKATSNAAAARVAPPPMPEVPVEDFEGQTSPQTESAGETPAEQVPEETPQNAAASRVKVDTSPKAVGKQLQESLGATEAPKPPKTVPGVKIKNQPAAQAALPSDFTPSPKESSVLQGYKYNPETQELDGITNTGARYRHAGVTPDIFAKFETEAADSPGTAWNNLRNTPGVEGLGKPNSEGVITNPRIKPKGMRSVEIDPETGEPKFSDELDAKRQNLQDFIAPDKQAKPVATSKAKAAAPAPAEDDLLSKLQQSVEQAKSVKSPSNLEQAITQAKTGKSGFTTVNPNELADRWGVSEKSLKVGREQTRGWSPMETDAEIKKLETRYRNGQAVDPVMETVDKDGNTIDVDGRGRVIAAKRAGIKKIPFIVRRIGVQ